MGCRCCDVRTCSWSWLNFWIGGCVNVVPRHRPASLAALHNLAKYQHNYRRAITGWRILTSFLLSFAQWGDGARASARFNIASHATCKTPRALAFITLKRRERRAPFTLAVDRRPGARLSQPQRVD